MKKRIMREGWMIATVFVAACITTWGQPVINRIEYYVDTDPGYGLATLVPAAAAANITTNFSISFAPLAEGVHVVGVRSRDENGIWSHDNRWVFLKPYSSNSSGPAPHIVRLEYFVDTDPGYGNGMPITITPGQDIGNAVINLSLIPLNPGVHVLGVRSKDANGVWSYDNRWIFLKPYPTSNSGAVPNITKVEYYLDTDPGKGNATDVPITPGADVAAVPISLGLTALQEGVHTFGVRSLDANGVWSQDNRWLFLKPHTASTTGPVSPVSQMEYYIDSDPGYGKAVQVQLTPGEDLAAKPIAVNINNLAAGAHYVYMRTRNANGVWSQDYRWNVNLANNLSGNSALVNSFVVGRACNEGTITLGYQASGAFNSGNQFVAQLSDATGSFANPVNIGNVTTTLLTGQLQITLPQNGAPPSSAYRVRINSTNPATTGEASRMPFTIYKYVIGKDTTVFVRCEFDTYNLNNINNFVFEGGSAVWNIADPTQAPVGTHLIYAVSAIGCKDTAAATVTQEANVWTGTANNNWFNPANWSRGKVPTNVTHVIVNSGTPNPCVLSGANATVASVRLNGGASISIQPGFNLVVMGTCNNLPAP